MKRIIHSNGLQSKNAKKRKLLKFREWCKEKDGNPTQSKKRSLKKSSEWGGKYGPISLGLSQNLK